MSGLCITCLGTGLGYRACEDLQLILPSTILALSVFRTESCSTTHPKPVSLFCHRLILFASPTTILPRRLAVEPLTQNTEETMRERSLLFYECPPAEGPTKTKSERAQTCVQPASTPPHAPAHHVIAVRSRSSPLFGNAGTSAANGLLITFCFICSNISDKSPIVLAWGSHGECLPL